MAIRVVKLGSPRTQGEGPRLGTVRRPPRGVRKTDYASGDWYDAWLPELSTSPELLSWFKRAQPVRDKDWFTFTKRFRAEMQAPEAQHLLDMLATLSKTSDFAIGCYCERKERCHRTILELILREAGANVDGP